MSKLFSRSLPSPAKLTDKDTDDWVKPFGCNHVIVSVHKQVTKASTDKPADKGEEIEDEDKTTPSLVYVSESYCIMCGEQIPTNDSAEDSVRKSGTRPDSAKTARKPRHRRSSDSTGSLKDSKNKKSPDVDKSFSKRVADRKRRVFERSASVKSLLTSSSNVSCAMHSHKNVKYFCEDHQELCCSVCVNVLHSRCNRVMFIKDVLNTSSDKEICTETVTALNNLSSSFHSITVLNQQALEDLEKQKEALRERQDSIKETLLRLIEEMEMETERKLKKFTKMVKNEIDANIQSCTNAIEDINTTSELLSGTLEDKSSLDIFIASRKILAQAHSYNTVLSDVMHHTKDVGINFTPESDITSIEHINTLGSLTFQMSEMHFSESITSSLVHLPEADVRTPRSVKDLFTLKVKPSSISPRQVALQGKFNVRLSDDKFVCENVGCTFLSDGRVALIDMKNCKLKVFDQKFLHGSSLKLSSAPRDITTINPIEVAVSLPDEGKIQFISVLKQPKLVRTIHTDIPCYGITQYNQELIVLCDSGFSKVAVQVLSLNGDVKRSIAMGKSGRVILKNPWYLTLNPDGQQIYVTDRSRLVCIDIAGSVIFQYTDEDLENARGVAIDTQGYLYVCGTSSNNVHQVSHDGRKVRVIVSEDDITSPLAVCYQPEKRMLLLTCTGSDVVTLYKTSK